MAQRRVYDWLTVIIEIWPKLFGYQMFKNHIFIFEDVVISYVDFDSKICLNPLIRLDRLKLQILCFQHYFWSKSPISSGLSIFQHLNVNFSYHSKHAKETNARADSTVNQKSYIQIWREWHQNVRKTIKQTNWTHKEIIIEEMDLNFEDMYDT